MTEISLINVDERTHVERLIDRELIVYLLCFRVCALGVVSSVRKTTELVECSGIVVENHRRHRLFRRSGTACIDCAHVEALGFKGTPESVQSESPIIEDCHCTLC